MTDRHPVEPNGLPFVAKCARLTHGVGWRGAAIVFGSLFIVVGLPTAIALDESDQLSRACASDSGWVVSRM